MRVAVGSLFYTVKQSSIDCNFCELEGDCTGLSHNPCANFDQPGLQAGQQPIGYLLGKVCALQEDTEIVGPTSPTPVVEFTVYCYSFLL